MEEDDFFNWYQGINFPGLKPIRYRPEYKLLFMKKIVRTVKCKETHSNF